MSTHRRRRHTLLRGNGSRRDTRTKKAAPTVEEKACPLCEGNVTIKHGVWRCLCGATGTRRPDGELALLSAPRIPKPTQRYRMDGTAIPQESA